MKAIRVHEVGGPEVLRLDEVGEPTPGPGQALVEIEASGVNYIDVYYRTGLYPAERPFIVGREAAGRVLAVGQGVASLGPGDLVAFTGATGTYAERNVFPAERLVKLPPGVSTRQAAAVMLQGMTADYLTTSVFPIGAGHTCLVHAAAGGVGLLLCQLAKQKGARVIGTVSTDDKERLARAAGADEVIRYREVDFQAEVRRLTAGAGVDVVYDGVGRTTFDQSLRSLKLRGTMVLFGQSSGPVPAFDPLLLSTLGSLVLTRPALHHFVHDRAELALRADRVLGAVASGALRLRIDDELPLTRAADAHRALEAGRTSGKLLLIP